MAEALPKRSDNKSKDNRERLMLMNGIMVEKRVKEKNEHYYTTKSLMMIG